MILSGNQFVYNGHPSYLYGLRFMWLDQSPEMALVAKKEYEYLYNRANNTFVVKHTKFDDPLSFDIEMLSDRVLQDFEVRRVYQMFFNQPHFKELQIIGDNSDYYYLKCIFINPERIEYGVGNSGGVVGFKATMTLDCPWARTDEKVITLSPTPTVGYCPIHGFIETDSEICTLSGCSETVSHNKVFLYNDSDCHDYIYPDAVITTSMDDISEATHAVTSDTDIITAGDGASTHYAFTITPNADGNSEVITLKPGLGTITSNSPEYASAISRSNKKFIRLVPGSNIFTLTNISSLVLTYREMRIIL